MDGIDVADSQLSIEKLSEVFGIDLFKDLDKRQKALSESMRIMIEEQFYWILVQDRYDVLNFGRNLGIRSSDKSKRNKNKNLHLRYIYQNAEPLKRYGQFMADAVPSWFNETLIDLLFLPYMRRWIGGMAYTQGTGRHDK